MVDLVVIDIHANKYMDGALPSTRLRFRLPRNAMVQSKSLPIDSDNLDLYGRAADPQYADKGSHERCNDALLEMRLSDAPDCAPFIFKKRSKIFVSSPPSSLRGPYRV